MTAKIVRFGSIDLQFDNTEGDNALRPIVVVEGGINVTGGTVIVSGGTFSALQSGAWNVGGTVNVVDGAVVIDYPHQQIQDGEMFQVFDERVTLATGTVSHSFTNGTVVPAHLVLTVDCSGGAALVKLYQGIAFAGGSTPTVFNRYIGSTINPYSWVVTGGTITGGTQFDSFIAEGRMECEWILPAGTAIYGVDIIGLDAGSEVVARFNWYES